MDDLVEFLLELLEIPFEIAMQSNKLKTWVKTLIFCIPSGCITLFFGYLSVISWLDNATTSALFCTLLTIGFVVFTVFGAIRGHKRKWKNP